MNPGPHRLVRPKPSGHRPNTDYRLSQIGMNFSEAWCVATWALLQGLWRAHKRFLIQAIDNTGLRRQFLQGRDLKKRVFERGFF